MKVLFFIVGLLLFAQVADLHQLFDIEKTEMVKKACEKETDEENGESKTKLKETEVDKYAQSAAAFCLCGTSFKKQMAYSKEASFYSAVVISALERPPCA